MKRLTKIYPSGSYGIVGDIDDAVHRLAAIEDILGNEYDLDRLRELAQADREGRCVVLPKADRSSYISIADLLSDDLTDWIHDPSVGLYGPNGEEAAIMRCFITALEGMKNG